MFIDTHLNNRLYSNKRVNICIKRNKMRFFYIGLFSVENEIIFRNTSKYNNQQNDLKIAIINTLTSE